MITQIGTSNHGSVMHHETSLRRDLFHSLLLGLAIFVTVGLMETTQITVALRQAGKDVAWWYTGSSNMVFWTLAGVLTPLPLLLTRLLPLAGRRRGLIVLAHVLLALAFGCLHASLYIVVRHLLGDVPAEKMGASLVKFSTGNMDREVLIYGVIMAAVTARDYYRGLQTERGRRAELRAQLSEARLDSLKMQLQPHFLFNAMHGVSTLIKRGDQSVAHDALLQLSEFLRLTLEDAGRHEVPLSRECEVLRAYLEVQQSRLGNAVTLDCDLDDGVDAALVPHLLLQPLAENSLRHGVGTRPGPCRLILSAGRQGDRLLLTLTDDGQGVPADLKPGRGLTNVRSRLEQLHPGDHTFTLTNHPEGGAMVRLDLPWRSA